MTFPLNSSKDYGSVRNIEITLKNLAPATHMPVPAAFWSTEATEDKKRSQPWHAKEITGIYGQHGPAGSRKSEEL